MPNGLATLSSSPRPSEVAAPGQFDDGRGISVLVVDDEHTLRESCASLLRAEEYTVTT